ncbi:MAG TPA: hypothetical protein VGV16_08260 [Gammaproteobacteria bacterium]|nr:hypothetical protein [Gammaproteobacteria bacterium]
MKKDARFYLPFVLAALLMGCGGGSGSSAPSTADIQGLWAGTYGQASSSTKTPLYAIVAADGSVSFFDDQGYVFLLPASSNLEGTVTADAPFFGSFEVNGKSVTQTTATLSSSGSAASLTGSFGFSDGTVDQFSLSPYKPFTGKPSVNTTSNWTGSYFEPIGAGTRPSPGIGISVGSASSGGSIFGVDGDCSVDGDIKQIAAGENLFTVIYQLTNSNPSGSNTDCNVGYEGFAFESTKDLTGQFSNAKGTYYYMVLSNSNAAAVIEFIAP